MMEERHLEASGRATSAASTSKGRITGRLPIELVAKVETARRVLRTKGIWSVAVKTLRQLRLWITRWGGQLWITRCGRWLWWTMRMRANKGVCSVEIVTNDVGFFAQMTWCLFIFQYCERHRLIPDIRLISDIYLDYGRGKNCLDYFFDLSCSMTSEELARRVRYTNKSGYMGPPISPRMSLEDGSRVLHKYLSLKPHINTLVNDFWRTLNVDGPVLGVHFRGTDKSTEAPRVSWEHCLKVLKNQQ